MLSKQPTPRKGTETRRSPATRRYPRGNNPHPARGRKHLSHQPQRREQIETTHTPQGDGNSFISRMDSSRMIGNNPHPARGRKHQLLALDLHPVCLETTHTPQGDGNQVASTQQFCWPHGNNPHPARGRKLFVVAVRPVPDADETTHTPQGDGNIAFAVVLYFIFEKIPTPPGDN